MSSYQEVLKCPSLFTNTEQPGQHVLEPAIRSDLFSKPRGSHEALHFLFEAVRNKDTPDYIKATINAVFRSRSMRETIMEKWNLYHGYDHAKRNESQINRYVAYDLASGCIDECHSCFEGLLAYGMIEPSSFCKTGHSFFWLAARSEKGSREQEELVEHLLFLISPEDLLRPFSVLEDRYSIFQVSAFYETRFDICLKRLGSLLVDGIASLGSEEIRQICGYVDPRRADYLLNFGLDLGKPHPDDAAPGWFSVVSRRTDPEPMLNWFWKRGYKHPEGFLKYAASYNLVKATRLIMDHDENSKNWCDAALTAAESTDEQSAEILEAILLRFAQKWEIEQTLAEDIVIKIVYGAYEAVELDSQEASREEIEAVAIDKVEALAALYGNVYVVGMKIMAESAGLFDLAMVLEGMNWQDYRDANTE
jgi:hypothetical protein